MTLNYKPHDAQLEIHKARGKRFRTVCTGRRFGKTLWQSILGASMQVIGRSLGHKSMKSTEVYARLNDDPVRASMGKAIEAMLITDGKEEVTK